MALGPKFLQAREQRKRKKVMAERSSSSQQEGALQRKAEASKQGRGGWEAGLVAAARGWQRIPPPAWPSQPASQPLLREPPRPLQAPAKAALRLCFFNPWGLLTQISIAGQGSIGKTLEVGT